MVDVNIEHIFVVILFSAHLIYNKNRTFTLNEFFQEDEELEVYFWYANELSLIYVDLKIYRWVYS